MNILKIALIAGSLCLFGSVAQASGGHGHSGYHSGGHTSHHHGGSHYNGQFNNGGRNNIYSPYGYGYGYGYRYGYGNGYIRNGYNGYYVVPPYSYYPYGYYNPYYTPYNFSYPIKPSIRYIPLPKKK